MAVTKQSEVQGSEQGAIGAKNTAVHQMLLAAGAYNDKGDFTSLGELLGNPGVGHEPLAQCLFSIAMCLLSLWT